MIKYRPIINRAIFFPKKLDILRKPCYNILIYESILTFEVTVA